MIQRDWLIHPVSPSRTFWGTCTFWVRLVNHLGTWYCPYLPHHWLVSLTEWEERAQRQILPAVRSLIQIKLVKYSLRFMPCRWREEERKTSFPWRTHGFMAALFLVEKKQSSLRRRREKVGWFLGPLYDALVVKQFRVKGWGIYQEIALLVEGFCEGRSSIFIYQRQLDCFYGIISVWQESKGLCSMVER